MLATILFRISNIKLYKIISEEHRLRIFENSAEENIWTYKRISGKRLEKIA
jgi:hypothetical protein